MRIADAQWIPSTPHQTWDALFDPEVLVSDLTPLKAVPWPSTAKAPPRAWPIGTAQVHLSPQDNGTRIAYSVAAMAGGKLAALGEPAIMKAGGKIVDKFFSGFIDHMAAQPCIAPPPPEPESRGLAASRWSWAVALAVVIVLVGYHTLFK